jgi:hypothetical protein
MTTRQTGSAHKDVPRTACRAGLLLRPAFTVGIGGLPSTERQSSAEPGGSGTAPPRGQPGDPAPQSTLDRSRACLDRLRLIPPAGYSSRPRLVTRSAGPRSSAAGSSAAKGPATRLSQRLSSAAHRRPEPRTAIPVPTELRIQLRCRRCKITVCSSFLTTGNRREPSGGAAASESMVSQDRGTLCSHAV